MKSLARKFDNGVQWFTIMSLEMNVSFPEDDVVCDWCPFIRHNDGLDRDKCALTEEIIFSRKLRGYHCPLRIINKVETEDFKNESNV